MTRVRNGLTQPTAGELDALTAWWLAHRHIGRAAVLLGRSRQTIANTLLTFRRLEGATDNVDLALKYLDEIERRKAGVLRRTSHSYGFGEAAERFVTPGRAYRDTDTASTQCIITSSFPTVVPILGRLTSTPAATISPARTYVTSGTESGESWVKASRHVKAAEAVCLQLGRFLSGQHRIPYELVVAEHGVVESQRHAVMVAA